jgi:hypothetical protein
MLFVSFLVLVIDILHNIAFLSETSHCFKIAVVVTFVVVVVGGGDGAVVTRVIILYTSHLRCQYFNIIFKDFLYTLYLIHINQFAIKFFFSVLKIQNNIFMLLNLW